MRTPISCFRFVALIAAFVVVGAEVRGQSAAARGADVLTLEQAVALALRDNVDVKKSEFDVGRAAQEFAAARTRRLPNISFNLTASQQLTPINFTFERGVFGDYPGIGPIPGETTKISTPMQPTALFITRVTQPLSRLPQINLSSNQVKLKGEIAREELRAQRQQIVRDVKQAYFALLQSQSALEAAAETVRMYKELDRVTGEYLAQQVVLRTDSLDVQSRLARSEYDTMTLIDQIQTRKQHLNRLLGRDITTDFSVTAVPEAGGYEADLAAAQTRALEQRPELKEARLKVKQAEIDRRLKKSEFIPEISASFQHISNANFNSLIPKNYMNVGVTVTWEVFDWGRKKHELAEKELVIEQARVAVRDAERATLIDINEKYNKLRQARQLLTVTDLSRAAAVETVRVLSNRYRAQVALLKEVLQAQTQLEQANDQRRQTLLSFWTAKAEFEHAIGEDK